MSLHGLNPCNYMDYRCGDH